MRLFEALREKEMDVRLRDRFLHEGRLSRKQLESYLKSLDENKDNFERVTVDQ